jgi:hypothetical protein
MRSLSWSFQRELDREAADAGDFALALALDAQIP